MIKAKKNKHILLVALLLFSSSMSACTEDIKYKNSEKSIIEKNKLEGETSPELNRDTSNENSEVTNQGDKTITYQKGDDSNFIQKTTLTFNKKKLVQERTISKFPLTNSNVKMSEEEIKKTIDQNKTSLDNVPGIEYDAKLIPNDLLQTIFTIDYTKIDINKVMWLTSFNIKTTFEDAVQMFEQEGFKKI